MAKVTYEYLRKNNHKCQVDSSIRDGTGKTIHEFYATKKELQTAVDNKLDKVTGATTSKQVYSKAIDGTQSMSDISTVISSTSTDEEVASAKATYTAAKPIIDTNTTIYYIRQVINGSTSTIELSSTPTGAEGEEECLISQFPIDSTSCDILVGGASIESPTKESIGLGNVDNYTTATIINASSTHTQFTTPKAVYDYIQSLNGEDIEY